MDSATTKQHEDVAKLRGAAARFADAVLAFLDGNPDRTANIVGAIHGTDGRTLNLVIDCAMNTVTFEPVPARKCPNPDCPSHQET